MDNYDAEHTETTRALSTSVIYDTIRKSKMAQDIIQPHSGRLVPSTDSTTDDMKCRFSGLQRINKGNTIAKTTTATTIATATAVAVTDEYREVS